MSASRIVVIGSINMDLVCRTERIPQPGETILGSDFTTIDGGKGANQAVAAAKLASSQEVHLVGRVGQDGFGERLLAGLQMHRVQTDHVTVTEGVASGVAVILVDRQGENSIVVASGANARLTPEDVDAAEPVIRDAAAVVLQLEIPIETVRHAIQLCRRLGVYTILDPAPVPSGGLPADLFEVDLFTPNRGEAERLIGPVAAHEVFSKKILDPKQVGSDLLGRGMGALAMKLGEQGAMLLDAAGHIERFAAHRIVPVDTTAAGDAFTAGLAIGRAEGWDLSRSVQFANAAGALCCTVFGAQPALPSREAVIKLLENPGLKRAV